jgi:hypothetical protein
VAAKILGITDAGDTQAGNAVAFPSEFDNGNETGTFDLDWNAGQKQRATLTGNITTLNITDLDAGAAANFILVLIQDITGNRTVVWPAAVLWPGGVAPTLGGPDAVDLIGFYWDGTNYYGVASLDFS